MKALNTVFVILFLISAFHLSAAAQGTAFNYQGHLNDGGAPATGSYDLTFTLFVTNNGGVAVAGPLTNSATAVSNGLFNIALDFGTGVFNGSALWLEIGVQTNNGSAFTTLTPRQPILPVPYAIMANNASNLLGALPATQLSGSIPAGQISGTFSQTQLPPALLTNNQSGVNLNGTFSGAFSGNGGTLANLNYSAVTNPPAIPSTSNLAATNDNRTLTFTNPANVFNGTFTGNGSQLTNLMNGLLSGASLVYMNFDSVNTSTGKVDATSYLASYGVTLTNVNPANSVFILNPSQDACASSASVPNRITQQVGGSSLVSYTFAFSTPLQSVTFTRCATSGGCASPGWTVTAYAGAVALTNVGPGINCLNCDNGHPAQSFTLNGPGITSITVAANGFNFSAYSSPPLDDFFLALPPALVVNGNVLATNFVGSGAGLTNLNAAQLSGSISPAQMPATVLTNGETGVTLNGTFNGNGGGLTNLNASLLNGLTSTSFVNKSGDTMTGPLNLPGSGLNIGTNVFVGQFIFGIKGLIFDNLDSQMSGINFIIHGAVTNAPPTLNPSGVLLFEAINGSPDGALTRNTSGDLGFWRQNASTWSETMRILNSSGNIGIGKTNPSTALDVNGVVAAGSFSGNGSNLTGLDASHLTTGTIPVAQLPAVVLTNNETGVTLTGAFAGNGGALGNLNFNAITNPPNIPSTITLVATNDTRVLTLANSGNNFAGTFGGAFSGDGNGLTNLPATPTMANFVESYSISTQAVVTASTFQNINSDVNGQINGWTHTLGTSSFTNAQSGLYLIHYTAIATVTSSTATTISLHALANGTEIADSQCSAVANTANQTIPISKSFIASFNSGDVLQFQFAGSGTIGRLVSSYGLGTTRPSFSCTIIRIQ